MYSVFSFIKCKFNCLHNFHIFCTMVMELIDQYCFLWVRPVVPLILFVRICVCKASVLLLFSEQWSGNILDIHCLLFCLVDFPSSVFIYFSHQENKLRLQRCLALCILPRGNIQGKCCANEVVLDHTPLSKKTCCNLSILCVQYPCMVRWVLWWHQGWQRLADHASPLDVHIFMKPGMKGLLYGTAVDQPTVIFNTDRFYHSWTMFL